MRLSSFSVNTIFIVLMLWGICLIPKLSLKLYPSGQSKSLSVGYGWSGAHPELLESEVTTKLEGALSRVRGLTSISSNTRDGSGYINMQINKNEDIDMIKLEISSILRTIRSDLPDGVRVGSVSGGSHKGKSGGSLLLNYVITGPGSTYDVARFAEDNISPVIGLMGGVEKVSVTGAVPYEWVMEYDKKMLESIGVSASDISSAISNYHIRRDAGKVLTSNDGDKEYSFIVIEGNNAEDKNNLDNIVVKKKGDKLIRLNELVKISYRQKDPSSYYRINGLNRINISIFSEDNTNRIDLADKLIPEMEKISSGLPDSYTLKLTNNATDDLREKINTILFRTSLTILILLCFVFVISRSLRYLLIISVSLAANICISFVFYYFLKLEINMYTMAGITVSLGIIIDNVIVMADHLRYHNNKRVFMAILAATLTTLGALWVVFGMGDGIMSNIQDFSSVILVNLSVSLAVSLLFVPALMEKISLKRPKSKKLIKRRRRIIRFNNIYYRLILFSKRRKKWLIVASILGFGIPVYMLPSVLEGEEWYVELYNTTIGSEFYSDVRPYVDKSLGGSLRMFSNGGNRGGHGGRGEESVKTTLNVKLTMPHGATIKQMNEAFLKLENYLSGFDEVEMFTCDIHSANSGSMNITFKKGHEMDGFPEYLKNELIVYANGIGNADATISGVGRGFSNSLGGGYKGNTIILTGYNYISLLKYADALKNNLKQNNRVKDIEISNGRASQKGFAIDADMHKLARNNADLGNMLGNLSSMAQAHDIPVRAYINDELSDVTIRSKNKGNLSLWGLNNRPLRGKGSVYKFSDIGKITEERAAISINKYNQEYKIELKYNFVGSWQLAEKIRKKAIDKIDKVMPVGFKAKSGSWRGWGRVGTGTKIYYVLLVFVIIFFICAILLESLKQALAIILIVPVSFIGCFLAFPLVGSSFGEGGYASFILLCGLVVNSALYIINDYNNKLLSGGNPGIRSYIKAFNSKIIPIFLTIASTILGFIPFLFGDGGVGFWYSLAVGTMSGLTFSIIVLLIFLPMFMPLLVKNSKEYEEYKSKKNKRRIRRLVRLYRVRRKRRRKTKRKLKRENREIAPVV